MSLIPEVVTNLSTIRASRPLCSASFSLIASLNETFNQQQRRKRGGAKNEIYRLRKLHDRILAIEVSLQCPYKNLSIQARANDLVRIWRMRSRCAAVIALFIEHSKEDFTGALYQSTACKCDYVHTIQEWIDRPTVWTGILLKWVQLMFPFDVCKFRGRCYVFCTFRGWISTNPGHNW